ncbi:YeiH family protein [Sporohalobacter salinus]|uniref:YeiH family protein n=1 Tax=Sporohalobacter salinus TaxID=1494606 RepID=UPI001960D3A9|nr:putative sulfate exporter family transporter [Sporohalobacter salinus]MBM7624571.1 putative integral membrane protein (TIGR00698 family) [Sporohalobacter salinus]
MKEIKDKLPGLILAIVIGLSGKYLSNWVSHLGGVTSAIILGIVVGNLFKLEGDYNSGIKFAAKKVLALAIVLMGLKLELNVLAELGLSSILIIMVMVVSTISIGYLLGRMMGLSKAFSFLLGVGNAVCGSSAIAAVKPVVEGKEEEVGLSISVVNLLGTIGIFLMPFLTYALKLADPVSGLMIGSTLQATGQVVASSFSISDTVGKLATVVKMGRILMLGPVVLVLSLLIDQESDSAKSKVSIPPFIIGFFILSIIGTLHFLPQGMITFLKSLGELLLIVAMAGIGLRVRISSLIKQGLQALVVGALIFISQLILIISLITIFF